jgi:hypothetical protein
MSESDPTGYRESPDLSDGPVNESQESDQDGEAAEDSATLTTDAEAQREDSITRPGNEPD